MQELINYQGPIQRHGKPHIEASVACTEGTRCWMRTHLLHGDITTHYNPFNFMMFWKQKRLLAHDCIHVLMIWYGSHLSVQPGDEFGESCCFVRLCKLPKYGTKSLNKQKKKAYEYVGTVHFGKCIGPLKYLGHPSKTSWSKQIISQDHKEKNSDQFLLKFTQNYWTEYQN